MGQPTKTVSTNENMEIINVETGDSFHVLIDTSPRNTLMYKFCNIFIMGNIELYFNEECLPCVFITSSLNNVVPGYLC